jgi:hypothetical protein
MRPAAAASAPIGRVVALGARETLILRGNDNSKTPACAQPPADMTYSSSRQRVEPSACV